MDTTFIPVAQYLRMSTDHQQYSIANQSDAIARYAVEHGFQVVATYSDPAKSGLRFKNRPGLQKLLKEIVSGQIQFRAVLVYDISRWGRFQDHDEAAHYEYLCKTAGVPVYYCAEMFGNDSGAIGCILKSLKRTMAGEFSRELSVKVKTGLTRLAKLGYKLGGAAPYGLRRQLLDRHGKPKQLLQFGERKNLTEEHVTFVPGPEEEVVIIRRIFRQFANEGESIVVITNRLNEENIPYIGGAKWTTQTIRATLQNPRYIGMLVWGQTTKVLSTPVKRLPISEWAIYPNAFEPIVEKHVFVRAQSIIANFTIRLSNAELVERLRRVLQIHGTLNTTLIDHSPLCASLTTYRKRFGGLLNIYAQVGYESPEATAQTLRFRQGCSKREELLRRVLETFPNQFEVVRKNKNLRPLLKHRKTGLLISFIFARACSEQNENPKWAIETPEAKKRGAALVALLDSSGNKIESLWVVRKLPSIYRHMRIRKGDEFFKKSKPLTSLANLVDTINSFRQTEESLTQKW